MSNETTAIQKAEAGQIDKASPAIDAANTLLGIIGAAVQNPEIDPAKVERLLSVYQTVLEDKRKTAFFAALARVQAKLPQIRRTGKIVDSKGGLRKYAKLEDLHTAIQPLLKEEGFAFSFNERSVNPNGSLFEISGTLSHKEGHSETKSITVPFDKSPYRTDIQSRGSSQSYAHRYLIKMHLNIVERGEDTDGAPTKPITKQQVNTIISLLKETKADEKRFLAYMKVGEVGAILDTDFQKAINVLETKKRGLGINA